MDPAHYRFLRFAVDGAHYQFCCLPFGLCSAPWTFSKGLSASIAALRVKDFHIFHYLDDILLLAQSSEILKEHITQACKTLSLFGWVVNLQKSQLQPTQILEYLRVQFNTILGRVFLPQRKVRQIRQDEGSNVRIISLCKRMHAVSRLSLVNNSSGSLGQMEKKDVSVQFPSPMGLDHQSLSQEIAVPAMVVRSLAWWINGQNLSMRVPLTLPDLLVVMMDASLQGWGAHCLGHQAQGKWKKMWSRSSNFLELEAVRRALLSFQSLLQGQVVKILSDNRTTVAYLMHEGRTKSLHLLKIACQIFQWAERNVSSLMATYLPGMKNVLADHQSVKV